MKLKPLIGKNEAISNFFIEDVCKKYGIQLNGVYMRNTLPEDMPIGNYIVNLEPTNCNGTHWVAIVVGTDQCCTFDSFGVVPCQQSYDLLKKKFDKIYYSTKDIQNLNSSACGYFCLGLLIYLTKTKKQPKTLARKVNDYTNLFSDDTTKNNKILFEFLKKNT